MTDATAMTPSGYAPPRPGPAPGWWILPMAFLGALFWGWLFSRLL